MPEFNPNTNYNDEYWKTYLQNEINCALIREISDKKSQLTELISQIEALLSLPRTFRTSTIVSTASKTAKKIED